MSAFLCLFYVVVSQYCIVIILCEASRTCMDLRHANTIISDLLIDTPRDRPLVLLGVEMLDRVVS